ncbi:helix-turn-helix domain-containing protein [Streptomyces sp. NBC_00986]|uniref:helix-turn-helix domain-containing protein n=1 Tax=Streptomyces sp. NBC_00986 TaxID=2903702 RepID=UPI003863B5C5|nr:helix-turn-helix transcriptional regulator [Streptomyces sp. NBC_00986]
MTGLRREKVALLAGVSADHYIKLERGNARGVSDSVLEALSRALRLDEAERAHLFALAHAAGTGTRAAARTPGPHVRPSIQRVLDSMSTTPAYVRDRRLDILATNRLGGALIGPVLATPDRPPNVARFMFLDPAAGDYYPDWERMAAGTVAILCAEAGRDPSLPRSYCRFCGSPMPSRVVMPVCSSAVGRAVKSTLLWRSWGG